MGRIRMHIYLEKSVLGTVDNIYNELEQKYRISKSDILNEAICYGLTIIKYRLKYGNKFVDQIFNDTKKKVSEIDKGRK